MSVTVVLPSQLRELAAGRGAVALEAAGGSVGEAFEVLRREHPAVWDRVFTEQRELRPHINVFVDRSDIRWSGGMETPVRDGCEIVVLRAVSGG